MTALPRLDVVVPTYNDPHRLRLCLEALALQWKDGIGVHVINDGGDDSAKGVVDSFPGRDDVSMSVRYAVIERGEAASTGRARNIGLIRALGPRVLFLDHDCVIGPGVLEAHAAYGDRPVVVAGVRRHVAREVAERAAFVADVVGRCDYGVDARFGDAWFRKQHGAEVVMNASAVYGCHMSVPTALARAIGGHWNAFRGWGHQDVEFACRLGRVGCRLAVRHDLVAYHLDHPGQATTEEIERANERLRDETYHDRSAIVRNGGPLEPPRCA